MKIQELDVVLLKDGRQGTVLGFYDKEKVFMMEISDSEGRTLDTPFIKIEEVKEIIYSAQ